MSTCRDATACQPFDRQFDQLRVDRHLIKQFGVRPIATPKQALGCDANYAPVAGGIGQSTGGEQFGVAIASIE
jgi:hypothetical protein